LGTKSGCGTLARRKHLFFVMASVPAPVVDHIKRSTIQDLASKSPFNIFNVVAVVAILVIGYFLYKKFNKKFAQGAIRMPVMATRPASQEAAPVVVETTPDEPEPQSKED
jgi:hypothetical protein